MSGSIDAESLRLLALRGPLPVLSPRGMDLVHAMSDPRIDFTQLARVVADYPSIAARVLAVANSAWSAPLEAIDSLEQACARLGLDVVRSLSIVLAVSAPFNVNACPAFDARRFWASALLASEGAALLAPGATGDARLAEDTARTAGLLHNLGLLLLAHHMPRQTSAALAQAAGGEEGAVMAAVRLHCGVGYDEAGAYLADAWRLPGAIADAMAHRVGDTDAGHAWTLQSPVGVAVMLAAAIQRGAVAVPEEGADVRVVAQADLHDVFERLLARAGALDGLADALVRR